MFAVQRYGLPANLKLSVHSGSDKFSLYPIMRRVLAEYNAGIHVKTSGTTWLEEVIGLAGSGGEGLAMAKTIYGAALEQIEENCGPYATVVDIDRTRLRPQPRWRNGVPRNLWPHSGTTPMPAVQPAPAAVAPRGLQGGGEDGPTLSRFG